MTDELNPNPEGKAPRLQLTEDSESKLRKMRLAAALRQHRIGRKKGQKLPSRKIGDTVMVWRRRGVKIEIETSTPKRFVLTCDSAAFAKRINIALATEHPFDHEGPVEFFRRVVQVQTAAFEQASRRQRRR